MAVGLEWWIENVADWGNNLSLICGNQKSIATTKSVDDDEFHTMK